MTVETGSFAHYLAFACAVAKISTHIMGYAPDTYRFAILDRKLRLVKGKKVLLQHGIIGNDIAELHYPKVNLDLFICSTVGEYESLVGSYNFPDGVIRRIGLCRYDALAREHRVRRQILIMPTWRYHLRPLSDADFQKSDYYRNYNGLLNNERLMSLLKEYGYELVLYLHYELQKFSGLFSGESDRVKVKRMADADVQQLLMESAMLITDYSSVYFDFAFMKKPLLYWMFDRERFFSEQYGKGYFVFEDDGFGPVFTHSEDIVDYIEKELKNGMRPEDEYIARVDRAFSDFSGDHCQKTYEAIAGLLQE